MGVHREARDLDPRGLPPGRRRLVFGVDRDATGNRTGNSTGNGIGPGSCDADLLRVISVPSPLILRAPLRDRAGISRSPEQLSDALGSMSPGAIGAADSGSCVRPCANPP